MIRFARGSLAACRSAWQRQLFSCAEALPSISFSRDLALVKRSIMSLLLLLGAAVSGAQERSQRHGCAYSDGSRHKRGGEGRAWISVRVRHQRHVPCAYAVRLAFHRASYCGMRTHVHHSSALIDSTPS